MGVTIESMSSNASTRNGSFSLSEIAHGFIEAGAESAGLSKSAWVDRAVIYYAIATSAPTTAATDAIDEALADENEAAAYDEAFPQQGAA